MIKLVFLGLIPLNMGANEPNPPKHRMSWYHYPLKDLMDVTRSRTELEVTEKREYVKFCKSLYENAQKRLDEIIIETNGYIGKTQNPTKENYKTVLVKQDVMKYSPSDIGVLRLEIECARQDYLNILKGKK